MPHSSQIANRISLIIKSLLHTSYFILLTSVLSGCTLIGTPKPAALQVTSTPEASLFLDGKHLGKTPFFSDQLKSGEFLLKITVSDAVYVENITLTGGTLTVVNRELANNFLAQSGEVLYLRPSEKGLFISSSPKDADITLDGRFVGKTPILLLEIEEGEHKILLAKTGYLEREFAIKTSSRYQLIADVTLAAEIAKNTQASQSPPPSPPPPQKVEVIKAPGGILRVRLEASATSTEVGRVRNGDQLEIIQETKDWIKITLPEKPVSGQPGKQGWIQAIYTKKL